MRIFPFTSYITDTSLKAKVVIGGKAGVDEKSQRTNPLTREGAACKVEWMADAATS